MLFRSEVYPIMNTNREQLMEMINQASFAMDDVLLFLDTHPCDQAALNYYHYVANARMNAMNAYQASYGPLLVDQVTSDNYWTWVNGTWPWEGGNSVCGDMRNACNTR